MKNRKMLAVIMALSLGATLVAPAVVSAEEAAAVEEAAEAVEETAEEAVEEGAEAVEEAAEAVEEAVEEGAEAVEEAVEEGAEAVEEAVEEGGEAAEDAAEGTESTLNNIITGIGALFGEGGELNGLISEDGIVSELLGEGGPLSGLVPEGIDVDGILGTLSEQLGDANSQIYETVEGIVDMVTTEDGSLDFDTIGTLVGSFLGGGEGSEEDESEYERIKKEIEEDEAQKEAIAAYTKEQNAETLEAGDITVSAVSLHDTKKALDDGSVKVLGCVRQGNYAAEGEELHLAGSAEDISVWTLAQGEDSAWTVTEEKKAENPDDAEELDALCQEVDLIAEDAKRVIDNFEISYLSEIANLFEEHPEYTSIEYNGEMVTKENIDKLIEECLSKLFEELFASMEEEDSEEAEAVEEEAEAEAAAEVEEAAEAVEEEAAEAAEAVEEAAAEVEEAAEEAAEETEEAVEEAEEAVEEAAEETEEAVEEAEEELEDAAEEAAEEIEGLLADGTEEGAEDTADDAAEEEPAA